MKIRDIVLEKKEPPKPRNFVAKNAKTAGAGVHKDAKKASKEVRGQKHKNKEMAEDNRTDYYVRIMTGPVYNSKGKYLGKWNGSTLTLDPDLHNKWVDENGEEWVNGTIDSAYDRLKAGQWTVKPESTPVAETYDQARAARIRYALMIKESDWLKGKEELNLKYYDYIYVENTDNGVLVHGEDIEGGYADQDGGEASGYFSFVANLNTGKIDLDYDDYNDSNNSYADSDSMEDIVRDILGDVKKEYGSTWEEITSELQGGFGIDESWGRQNFEVLGYKYVTDIDEEEDNRKIWHTLVSPEGKSHTVDWSPYSYMSPKDVKFYIKLGMPKRVDSGPLDTDKLVKMAQMKGIANLDPELANAGKNVAERVRDPEDWDEGNTEPPNNFAVYINGKKWKVFKGRGQYADDMAERNHYRQLQDWAAKKTAASGKKWQVFVTGDPATESIAETSQAYKDAMAKSREAEINYRADRAEKKLAKKAAEPKTVGQKIAKDIGGPLKKLAKGDIKGALGEKAPPGFKGTVKAMKKHKDIDNPFALAWSMKNKGYKSHKKADGSDK